MHASLVICQQCFGIMFVEPSERICPLCKMIDSLTYLKNFLGDESVKKYYNIPISWVKRGVQ